MYSTYVGEDGSQDGADLALGEAGNVFLTGSVSGNEEIPPTVPTTAGAFDTTPNGGTDAFVVELSPSGSDLAYGSYLGGAGDDGGTSIALDATGAAFVAGWTEPDAVGFPTTAGAYDTSPTLSTDAFVSKVAPGGGSLAYSTLLGGTGNELAYGIAVDAAGAAYVTGQTSDSGAEDFPTTGDALDASPNGGSDAFVTKVSPTGSGLVYSTLTGSASTDAGSGVAVASSGRVAVVGNTRLDGFPTTPGAFDRRTRG